MSVALVFPGQGAQSVGMGRDLAEHVPSARAVFDLVDASLASDARALSSLCFDGPESELTLTANTQPAILAVSVACLRALRAAVPSLTPAFYAGHSLGEYSALVASGALRLDDAARLLRLRGRAMQDAVAPGVGAMSAILMLDLPTVRALCDEAMSALPGLVVQPANDNAPGQVVVAGHAEAVARVNALADARRGRAMPLKVSAPFHCALMEPAAARLEDALRTITLSAPSTPIVANVDAAATSDEARVRSLLVRQVAGLVRWRESVEAMVAAGVTTFVEVGPGRVLSGLIKRIHKGARTLSVSDRASLEETAAALSAGRATEVTDV